MDIDSIVKEPITLRISMFQAALLCLFFIVILSEQAFAHGFAYYASTPTTPPSEFLWWWPFSMFLLALGTYFPLRMSLKWSRLCSAFIALLWVVVFAVIFWLIGRMAANFHTGPPPGLGPPCATYWGRTFSQVGSIFLFWNCSGLVLFMAGPIVFLYKYGKNVGNPKRLVFWSWIIAIPFCFTLGLAPYITTGAWVHGWGGGHVGMFCRNQINELHNALVMYTLDHDNRLPVAKDYAELYPQIEPYLGPLQKRRYGTLDFCVIGKVWDRTPKSFIWNTELSGKEIFRTCTYWLDVDLNITDPIVDFDDKEIRVSGKPWVNCPYHPQKFMLGGSGDIRNIELEKLERLRKYQRPTTESTKPSAVK